MIVTVAELSKEAKIVFIINAILSFIYTFLFLIIPDTYAQMAEAAIYNPVSYRQIGASILVLGIGAVLVIKGDDLEKAKIFWEIAIIWLILMLIIGIWGVFAFPGTVTAQTDTWVGNSVLIVLAVLNIYVYYRDTK
jgi:hypothetical protein